MTLEWRPDERNLSKMSCPNSRETWVEPSEKLRIQKITNYESKWTPRKFNLFCGFFMFKISEHTLADNGYRRAVEKIFQRKDGKEIKIMTYETVPNPDAVVVLGRTKA